MWARVSAGRWGHPGPPSMPACLCTHMRRERLTVGGHPVPGVGDWPPPAPPTGARQRAGLRAAGGRVALPGKVGCGGGSRRPPEEAPAFPIRKHILWASGRYLLQLATPSSSPKTASKTTISSLPRDGEDAGARHTHTHAPPLPSAFQAQLLCGRGAGRGSDPPPTAPRRPAPRLPRSGPESGQPRALPPRLPVGFCSLQPPPPRKTAHSGLGALAAASVCPPGWEALASAQAWRCSRCRRPGKGPARRAPSHLPPGPSRHRRRA